MSTKKTYVVKDTDLSKIRTHSVKSLKKKLADANFVKNGVNWTLVEGSKTTAKTRELIGLLVEHELIQKT